MYKILKNFKFFFVLTLLASTTWALEGGICTDCGAVSPKAPTDAKKISQAAFNELNFLSPELIEQMDSRELAEMIIQRLHERCDKVRDPSLLPSNNESEIMMLVPDKYIASIAKYGFKNQHQTSSTNGIDSKAMRLTAEQTHIAMDLPYSHKTRELLPKYALQVFSNNAHGSFGLPKGYGNVIFRFKPIVKKRATWSFDDSLGMQETLRTYFIREPNITCGKGYNYCESQIWGELDMTDVESVVIPQNLELNEDLKNLGLPIYTYENLKFQEESKIGIRAKFSEKPIYQPISKPKPAVSLTSAQIETQLKNAQGGEANILRSQRLSKLSTDQLIKEYNGSEKNTTDAQYDDPDDKELASFHTRILTELAARPNTSEKVDFLFKIAKEGSTQKIKSTAFGGLISLPLEQIKPLLLKFMKHADDDIITHTQNINPLYIGLQHIDDPDIKAFFDKEFTWPGFMPYLLNKNICEKENYK